MTAEGLDDRYVELYRLRIIPMLSRFCSDGHDSEVLLGKGKLGELQWQFYVDGEYVGFVPFLMDKYSEIWDAYYDAVQATPSPTVVDAKWAESIAIPECGFPSEKIVVDADNLVVVEEIPNSLP